MGRKKARFYKDQPKVKVPSDTNVALLERGASDAASALAAPSPPSTVTAAQVGGGRRQKLLEKYIAKKLKKEARPGIMARLGQLAWSGDGLRSTTQLAVPSSRREAAQPKEHGAEEESEQDSEGKEEEEEEQKQAQEARLLARKRAAAAAVASVPDATVNLHAAIASIKKSSLNPLAEDSSASDDEPKDANLAHSDLEDDHGAMATMTTDSTSTSPPPPPLLPPWTTFYVLVERTAEIEEQRTKLPIYAEEQRIMEAIRANPVVVVCGETGSGKTTQVPQFLYEAGFGDASGPNPGLVGVTQPRRVAAVSMAQRVSAELNRPEHVAHQVRYDGTVRRETRVKFMTDGILLRELAEDFLLTKYSIILLDEAHERNLNTDILIGMLSRAVRMRNQLALRQEAKPLRLVIMSATLNVDEFVNGRLFQPAPPVLQVEARQHPVTMHFARRTETDHVEAAYRMVCKIHANLPSGGVLVFLTGKQEIVRLAQRLNRRYAGRTRAESWAEDVDANMDMDGDEPDEPAESDNEDMTCSDPDGPAAAADGDDDNDEEEVDDDDGDGDGDGDGDEFAMGAQTREPLLVLPLYSLLAPEEQMKVFQAPPEGTRLCVLATNVAETSLTIPNIRYVVDGGLVKQRRFDPATSAQEYRVEWTSKASATQRAGRAGRVGPGHCYRLYSSAVFESQFPEYSVPEIMRTPIEGLVLQLRTMGIDKPECFPLPSPPAAEAIATAKRALQRLRALQGESLTPLGRMMAGLPLAPVWARLVIVGLQLGHDAGQIVALAAVMSVGDPFLDQQSSDTAADADADAREQTHLHSRSLRNAQLELAGKPPSSDLLMWLGAFIRYEATARRDRRQFCQQFHLMPKRLEEMSMQYHLLLRVLKPSYPHIAAEIAPLRRADGVTLRKLISESLTERGAERIRNPSSRPGFKRLPFPAYRLLGRPADAPDAVVYLHPTSVLTGMPPPHLVYTELIQTEEDTRYIKYVTSVELGWL